MPETVVFNQNQLGISVISMTSRPNNIGPNMTAAIIISNRFCFLFRMWAYAEVSVFTEGMLPSTYEGSFLVFACIVSKLETISLKDRLFLMKSDKATK